MALNAPPNPEEYVLLYFITMHHTKDASELLPGLDEKLGVNRESYNPEDLSKQVLRAEEKLGLSGKTLEEKKDLYYRALAESVTLETWHKKLESLDSNTQPFVSWAGFRLLYTWVKGTNNPENQDMLLHRMPLRRQQLHLNAILQHLAPTTSFSSKYLRSANR
ncbi:hypothetical protein BU26DRAFT_561214 [Trematosphaeria pertusa]|uniref:Uncharacterized protein n=1 Tax=Trematosphaeria pertusa TaxID=390896 RepID=A0A6A6IVK5_9PLEO|nr:uncharacterized protein BU26DRAFT_561214 [Trematosphaeria pertusa]KAF2253952.1 hypothetical protein BU26DRAFT_561214 [Trematosphaeria pertusa]